MADTIHPWIFDYLVHNGETYGGNLSTIPIASKGKKVQLIEVITTWQSIVWIELSVFRPVPDIRQVGSR